jgi:hypothetical protein
MRELLNRLKPALQLKTKSRALEVVERVALTQHHSLHLVRWNGRTLVVAAFAGGCKVLAKDE